MKIAVIGTVNKDLILPFEGASIQSVGGIYYTITALSNLSGAEVEIIPIAYLGEDFYAAFVALLKQYPNVSPRGLIPLLQKNHEVILEYISPEERKEKALFNFPPLEFSAIEPFLDADFFLVNFITGWDVSLSALKELSQRAFERLYMDVHFLVMGVDKLGHRFPQRPENIREWLSQARFVQMNEREQRIIAGGEMPDMAFYEAYFQPNQILLVTQGRRGAKILFSREGKIRKKEFPPYFVDRVVDVTGCGDVFGAAFVRRYLDTGDLYDAVDFANRIAAANSLLMGTNEMDKLLATAENLTKKESK